VDAKLLAKVRALLAKAESTTFPEEADALTTKAMQLMASYGITDAMLAAQGKASDPLGERRITITDPYSMEKAQLLASIAEALGCRSLVYMAGARRVDSCLLAGHKTTRERAELLFTSLLLQATARVQRIIMVADSSITVARRSWWAGFSFSVQTRLTHAEQDAAADYDAEHSSSGAELVLVSRRDEVSRWFDRQHGELESAEVKQPAMDLIAFLIGMREGNAADLGDGGLGTPAASPALPS
jgi:hypothetical protein